MMPSGSTGGSPTDRIHLRILSEVRHLVEESDGLDRAIRNAVAATPTPHLDIPITWISNAADLSRIWIAVAVALASVGGHRGRRAAVRGMAAVGATSVVANLAAKRAVPRRRPFRSDEGARSEARMPSSSSFPSGHTASAFAFATAITADVPELTALLYGMATLIGVSRVLTGVHYPSDVIGGGVLGLSTGTAIREVSLRAFPPNGRLHLR